MTEIRLVFDTEIHQKSRKQGARRFPILKTELFLARGMSEQFESQLFLAFHFQLSIV